MAGRGGKREGAGGKLGRKNKRSARLNEEKAVRILQGDIVPLDVMMDDVRFWNRELKKLDAEIEQQVPAGESLLKMDRDTGLGKEYFYCRTQRSEAAFKAAPFVHAKMASIDPPSGGGMQDLSKLTDNELDALERITRKISGAYGGTEGEGSSQS